MVYNDKKDLLGILEERSPAEVYTPSNEEMELASALTQRFQSAYRHRLTWERQWEINWLYQRGEQPVRNLSTGEVFRLPQDDEHRLVSGNNIIRPTARSLLGKLTKAIPTCSVVPPTSDLADINGALVGDSLLYYLRRKEKLDRKYIKSYRDVNTFGMSWLKLSWDQNYGREIGLCKACGYREGEWNSEMEGKACPQCEAELGSQYEETLASYQNQVELEAQSLGVLPETLNIADSPVPPEIPILAREREGDIRVDTLDPREVFIDPSASELEDAQWWCHRVPLHVTVARQRFPKMAKYLDKEGGIHSEQYVTLVRGTTTFRAATRQLHDHLYIYEFHEKPTKNYPDGRIIWMGNGLILEQVDSPYYSKLHRFPLYVFYWERNAGELYGESWIEQAAPLQREYNILLTQMREHRELTNNPQSLVPSNSGIAIEEFDTTAGKITMYNSMGGKPEWRPIPPMADYIYNETARLESAIRTHASVTEQEVGQTRSDASGRYIAILESEASQQVGPILKENAIEWIELHRGMLILVQSFYTSDRTWTITGRDRPRTYYFDDLNLSPGWDVDIQEEDSLSKNQAVRLSQAMELANGPVTSQLFIDSKTGQFDVKRFIAKSGIKMPDMTPETRSGDHAWAAAIPAMLKNGEDYTPQPWDDPEIFVEELEAWLKGPGRTEVSSLVQKVGQFYTFYVQRTQAGLAQQRAAIGQSTGKPSKNGSSSSVSSSTSSPASMPSTPPSATSPSNAPEAQAISEQGDQEAESASRMLPQHEG